MAQFKHVDVIEVHIWGQRVGAVAAEATIRSAGTCRGVE